MSETLAIPLSEDQIKANEFLLERVLDDVPLTDFIAKGTLPTAIEGTEIPLDLPVTPLRERLVWAGGLGWLRWDGKRWAACTREAVVEDVRVAVRALYLDLASRATRPADAVRLKVLLSKSKVTAVAELLRGVLEADPASFDAQPDLLNVQNGVVDLRTGDVTPHDPALRFTKITRGRYGVNTMHADWFKTLRSLPEDVRDYMQVRYGQAITGHITSDDKLPIQQGGGRNAKSTLVDGVVNAAGDFADMVPEDVLTAGANAHPTGLMTLRGVRLAVIEELPEGRQLPVKRLKDLQGTQKITARFMRQDFVTFNATHSLFLNTNYVPKVAETDHGTWERLLLVKFPYTYVSPPDVVLDPLHEREADPGLRGRMERGDDDVWDAVLFWLVSGAVRWYENGKTMPPMPLTVADDTQTWREDADLILAYIGQRLEFDTGSAVAGGELYSDFSMWLASHGHAEWSQETFANRFSSHKVIERAKVEKGVTRNHSIVSRAGGPKYANPLPAQVRVWNGVRFKGGE